MTILYCSHVSYPRRRGLVGKSNHFKTRLLYRGEVWKPMLGYYVGGLHGYECTTSILVSKNLRVGIKIGIPTKW